ncbi:MAG: class I SAM-dependent methyltransferase [Clostridia bacterium]|nr:class I SAM-dependent methyltransferase [Clostridia bacterium]
MYNILQVAVTSSLEDSLISRQAMNYAEILGIPFITRKKMSLNKIREMYELDYLLVVEKEKVILKGETTLFWHPSMAVPRLKALRNGNIDSMIEAMDLKVNYNILDCTLGMAADALVSAFAVGIKGKVTGLEANKYIAFITKWGMDNFAGQNTHIKELFPRINAINIRYENFLEKQADNSFDVVYFDPMFRRGFHRSNSINAMRPFAEHQALNIEIIEEALRVAKYRVVLKESSSSSEFERLGCKEIMGGKYSHLAYGVWKKY